LGLELKKTGKLFLIWSDAKNLVVSAWGLT
jgi:hypothetical protein